MSKEKDLFSLVHRIRPRMEFSKYLRSLKNTNDHKNIRLYLDRVMKSGDYPAHIENFLSLSFRTIQDELILPFLKANPLDLKNNWNIISGAFTYFSGEAGKAIPYFLNWDKTDGKVQHSVNPGFKMYCDTLRSQSNENEICNHPDIENIHECPELRNCLGKFLDRIKYTGSRLIERKLPVRSFISFELEKLNEVASNDAEAQRVFTELKKLADIAPGKSIVENDSIRSSSSIKKELAETADFLSPDVLDLVVDIYEQFKSTALFPLSNGKFNESERKMSNKLQLENINYLSTENLETGHDYSLKEFANLVLSLSVIYQAPYFYLLHFGPAIKEERDDDFPVGTGTLAINSFMLRDELLSYISLLADTAISSISKAEAVVLQHRHETTKRNLLLAESAYGVGHTQKDRFTRLRGQLENAEDYLSPDLLDSAEAAVWVSKARASAKKAADSSTTMDFMANLFQVNGEIEKVDSRFFPEEDEGPYNIHEHLKDEIKTFDVPFELNASNIENLRIIDNVDENKRRLYDEFYDDILHELLANAVKATTDNIVQLEINYQPIDLKLDNSKDKFECLVISNETRYSDFESRLGLSVGNWTEWDIGEKGPKGALRQIAIRLKATNQGLLLAKPDLKNDKYYFRIGLYLFNMINRTNDKHGG
ncbi:MAG: hypothetical protein U5O15_08280 [Candidatus Krumholzibacteriota bacterium]|nr:hypothetical protein [Candidatus Krumholzibacteriota bacterium]